MRANLPVTQQENPFPHGTTLVSVTDAKGRILYCNQAFIEVSGFTSDELLGQPHNVIRHPDVPEETFRDLWDTIQGGRPWSAVVKNRRKDGSHYWVVANVTPLMEDGTPTGYMSVRTEATREQVLAAEALFARMREEKEEGQLTTLFRNGRPVQSSFWRQLKERLRPTLSIRLLLALAVLSTLSGGMFWITHHHAVASSWGFVASTVITVVWWRILSRWFIGPLDALIDTTNRIAGCDLTEVVTRDRNDRYGELQTALGQVVVNLQSVVRDARDQNMQMFSSMAGMSKGSAGLAERTESQAASLEQTAMALEEMTATAQSTAASARGAANATTTAVSITEASATSVQELSHTMEAIREASERIRNITQVINSIAFQTNILALNAAVEAARAGESGKGFAVVAAEVRALSQRTSAAATEISEIVTTASNCIEQGHEKSGTALQSMLQAVDRIRGVHDAVESIDRASADQLTGIAEINKAVASLDVVTRDNVVFADQMAKASHDLERLSEAATETVRVFRVDAQRRASKDALSLRREAKLREIPALT
jgi:PAS domain S-box